MIKKSIFGMLYVSKDEGIKFVMVMFFYYIVNCWGESCIRKMLFRYFGLLFDGYLFFLFGILFVIFM